MADYFLSLNVASSKNLVDRGRNFFHKHGISTWMCTDIEGGDTYREEIIANVRDAKVFLIFLNEKWAQSQECTFEYNYAMRKKLLKEKPVIMPVVTESFDLEKYAHVDALMANFQGLFISNDYGTHCVLYEGQVMGVQMIGRWNLETSPDIRGEWAMWPIS